MNEYGLFVGLVVVDGWMDGWMDGDFVSLLVCWFRIFFTTWSCSSLFSLFFGGVLLYLFFFGGVASLLAGWLAGFIATSDVLPPTLPLVVGSHLALSRSLASALVCFDYYFYVPT